VCFWSPVVDVVVCVDSWFAVSMLRHIKLNKWPAALIVQLAKGLAFRGERGNGVVTLAMWKPCVEGWGMCSYAGGVCALALWLVCRVSCVGSCNSDQWLNQHGWFVLMAVLVWR
jgi:hypothetical protein